MRTKKDKRTTEEIMKQLDSLRISYKRFEEFDVPSKKIFAVTMMNPFPRLADTRSFAGKDLVAHIQEIMQELEAASAEYLIARELFSATIDTVSDATMGITRGYIKHSVSDKNNHNNWTYSVWVNGDEAAKAKYRDYLLNVEKSYKAAMAEKERKRLERERYKMVKMTKIELAKRVELLEKELAKQQGAKKDGARK